MSTPLRLLLVESDVDNALTLQQLTAGQAIEMRMVDNGRKAIELVEEQSFDLILMSLQAPIMSGQAAAAAIRLAEQSNRSRPVFLVALDSEGTYDAGEDALRDFDALVTAPLVKQPIDEVMLQARARAQNVSLAEMVQSSAESSVPEPPTSAAVGIPEDILSALTPATPAVAPEPAAKAHISVHISSDMAGLAPDFLNKRRPDVDKLKRALDEQKFDSVRVLGKSMKGTGAIYGFEQIAELGKSLEQAAVDESTDTIETLTLDLEDFLERVELVID